MLIRNLNTSFVAVEDDEIIGTVMAGHDGYRGYIHHTCVLDKFRKKVLARYCLMQLWML